MYAEMGGQTIDRFIALYRGINVGGANPVKMESLRAMHDRFGHRDIESYVQSGNIVFSASGQAEKIAREIARGFLEELGFKSHVMVVTEARWNTLFRDNPFATFSEKDPKLVHAGLCDGNPSAKGLRALHEKTGGTESLVVKGNIIYLRAPDGLGRSKFAAGMEKACGVPTTIRNWRTIDALWKMLRCAH